MKPAPDSWRRNSFLRRAPAVLLGFALSFLACFGPDPESAPPPPDFDFGPHPIIILNIDTLRADHLGSYGYARDTSPNIDALARESILFEWAFSQAPNTPPSQASILTALYPTSHGFTGVNDRLAPEATTLAEVSRAAGFCTTAFVDGGYMSPDFGLDQGFDLYQDSLKGGLSTMEDEIFEWLRQHAEERFLLMIHTYDVHSPYAPPEPFRSSFLTGLEPPTPGFEPTSEALEAIRKSNWGDSPINLAANDLEYTKALYDGGIRYVDDWIGRFIAELEALGLMDRATIVLISDHGEEFLEHGSVLHEKLYSTVTRIPFLIRLPGGKYASRVPEVVEGVDLMPTLLELVGVPPPPGIQGQSLLPLLRGEAMRPPIAFGEAEFLDQNFVALGDHRLLYIARNKATELYEFRRDPLELEELSSRKPEVTQRLIAHLEQWQKMVDKSKLESPSPGAIDEKTLESLRALGYIE